MSFEQIIRYVYTTLSVAILLLIPSLVIRRYFTKGKFKNGTIKHELASIAFIFYLLNLYQITALRFGGIGWSFEDMLERNTRVNEVPLVIAWKWIVVGDWWHLFYNVVGNCVWFIPMGILLPAIYTHYRGKGVRIIFIGLVVSASIEVLQYFLCTGVTDIDDVIFNTLGTAMGYGIWLIFEHLRKKIKQNNV